ncbi:MAG: hypothetical protein GF330_01705 [Candidatus Eisenbacteria bacterium]|nr:hypothetical protein [Candidatus Eisenbacteria bacterium]
MEWRSVRDVHGGCQQWSARQSAAGQWVGGRTARLLVPGSSRFSEITSEWGAGAEWAEHCYEVADEQIDGINFHLRNWRHVLNLHRYAEEIQLAHEIIATTDSDGDTLEAVVCDQTKISSGPDISPYHANGFYAALWWAGVVCRTLGTG